MSTGKRLAKRSILGTKVMVPGKDGRYYSGHIMAVKSPYDESASAPPRYSVRFEETRRTFEFAEKDVVGPGFSSVSSVQLLAGQVVYVTHNQREMQGRVVRHDFFAQDVLITVNQGGNEEDTILAKVDDVRLLESRKSARLVNSDTDFSKLADINISMADKKRNASGSSAASSVASEQCAKSSVPRSDYVQIAGSRKRRTSENHPDDEETLSECSAAMLLMKLSCSPHSPMFAPSSSAASSAPSNATGAAVPSPLGSSSGASSFRSATPSPPLSTSNTDEGIVKDLSRGGKKKITIYQCTYPGCHERRSTVDSIESHVRVEHLNRPEELDLSVDEADRDHEEEFYYTETEVTEEEWSRMAAPQQTFQPPPPSRRMASLSLADHLDMARPAHEDPSGSGSSPSVGKQFRPAAAVTVVRRKAHHSAVGGTGSGQTQQSLLSRSLPNQSSMPIAIAPSPTSSSGSKFILISPPAARSPNSVSSTISSSSASAAGEGKSPTKRIREGKKCRKVYGLEQRDLWCTQCKWKKACARFGMHATEPLPSSSTTASSSSSGVQVSSASLLAPSVVASSSSLPSASATTVLTGVKAIKF